MLFSEQQDFSVHLSLEFHLHTNDVTFNLETLQTGKTINISYKGVCIYFI